MLTLLLLSMLTLAFNIQPVKAVGGIIFIRADGSIDPPTANITSVDNVTYYFTDNNYDSIIIGRDNIVVDGAGYAVQGTGSGNGIHLFFRSNVTIRNTNVKGFEYGIRLDSSNYNSIAANSVSENLWGGILLFRSSNYNSIVGNNIANNMDGIALSESSNNNVSRNDVVANKRFGIELRPYDGTLPSPSDNSIVQNNITDNEVGIALYGFSNHNSIIGNDITNNQAGVGLIESSNNSIIGNNITNNWDGAVIDGSDYNSISGNSVTENNDYGIILHSSSYNSISGNNIAENNLYGILLGSSSNNSIAGNMFSNDGLVVWDSYWNVVEDNLVNGEPLVYLEEVSGFTIENAGQVILINCDNLKVENLNFSHTDIGIQLCNTTNTKITENNITNNLYGVYLSSSSNNNIDGNRIIEKNWAGILLFGSSDYNSIIGNNITNNEYGIGLDSSSNNRLWHNNFIGNTRQVYDSSWDYPQYYSPSINVWDDGYPSGGNYWSDYKERYPDAEELDDSGIWNTPYIIDENNQDRYPLVNPWTPAPNQPPTCIISLQKNGIEISEVEIGEFLDIFAGYSIDDKGIKQIRFSSDDVQDGMPTGRWTDWFDWDASREDWDASAKIKRWSFATPGYKEVWAEAKDEEGQTNLCSDIIFVPAPALPVLVSPLVTTPTKEIYNVGDTLEADFTIKNIGDVPITLDVLTVGGRLNGFIPPEGAPDFTFQSVTLQPEESHEYHGSLTLTQMGNYRFFVAYRIDNPTPEEKKLLDENNWNTCVELGEGLTQTDRVKNILVFEEGTVPEDVNALRDEIDRLMKRQDYYPPYLLEADSWNDAVATLWVDFTSFMQGTRFREKYDNWYQTGWNYRWLRIRALRDASSFLDKGDMTNAKKYLQKSHTYDKLSGMSFGTAAQIFDGYIAAEQAKLEEVKRWCEVAVKLGISIVFPPAALWVDVFYTGFDFAFNAALEGWDQDAKDLLIDVVFIVIFKQVKLDTLHYNTLESYVNRVAGNVPLDTLLENKEFMAEFGTELKEVMLYRIGEEVGEEDIEQIVRYVIRYYESMKDYFQIKGNSPIELRVVDSEGRVAGIVNNKVKHEISMSLYYNETVTILFPTDTYQIEVLGTDEGTYGLEVTSKQNGSISFFYATDIPVSRNAFHNYTIDWVSLSQGEEGVTVQVDSDGDGVFEHTFTSDSELNQSEYLTAIGRDIAVVDVLLSTNATYVGRTVTINVTASNLGNTTETFNVSLYYDNNLINTTLIENLPPHTNKTITFHWDTTGVKPCNNYNITAKADILLGETNTTNNNLTDGKVKIKMIGDVDGNGKVDIRDIAMAARAFGSYPGHPRWDPDLDFNNDGKINIRDLVLVARNFGKCI